jgi:hypothetical protein
MRLLMVAAIFLFGSSTISYADPQKGDLTDKQLKSLADHLKDEPGTVVDDKGTYYFFIVPKREKFYVVTKPNNDAHPGYIEWSIRVKDGRMFLDGKGVHGANGDEFHKFESAMNEAMVNSLKNQSSNSGK